MSDHSVFEMFKSLDHAEHLYKEVSAHTKTDEERDVSFLLSLLVNTEIESVMVQTGGPRRFRRKFKSSQRHARKMRRKTRGLKGRLTTPLASSSLDTYPTSSLPIGMTSRI